MFSHNLRHLEILLKCVRSARCTNNIERKTFPRHFIFSLYFWQSLGFEPTSIPNPEKDANDYAIEHL